MQLEINGDLLKRLMALSASRNIKPNLLGLQAFENGLLRAEAEPLCYAVLGKMAKRDIKNNNSLSDGKLAARHHCAPLAIREHRRRLAEQYLVSHEWQTETDGTIGERFGLPDIDIMNLRTRLQMFRLRGRTNGSHGTSPQDYIKKLGGMDAIKKALTESGKTITELFRDGKIVGLGRERMRQIVGSVGITGDRSQRTPLWHAHCLIPEGSKDRKRIVNQIANPETLRVLLAKAGGVHALTGVLGITSVYTLRNFALNQAGLTKESDRKLLFSHGELTELRCSESSCGKKFFRPKWMVDREKKRNPDKLNFCCKICQGRNLGKNFGRRNPKLR